MGRRRWLYRLTSRMQLFCTSILSQPVWVSAATGYLFADCLGNIVLWFLLPRLLLDGGGQKRREFRKIIFTTRRAKDHQFGTPFPWVRAGPADENDYGRANTVSFYLERGGGEIIKPTSDGFLTTSENHENGPNVHRVFNDNRDVLCITVKTPSSGFFFAIFLRLIWINKWHTINFAYFMDSLISLA